jgi:cytochrome c oxidase subunit 2
MLAWLGRWLPVQASAHAAAIDTILLLVHGLMLALFLGWLAYFLFVLVRFRQRRNPTASYYGAKGHVSHAVEVGVVIAEGALLVGFAIPAWSLRVNAAPPAADATVIHIVAEQFAWNVHYPGADGKFGRTSADLVNLDNPLGLDRRDPAAADDVTLLNELNLPDDKPVLIYVSSKDVIHSFSLPEMRVKQDVIPGMSIPVWFMPTRDTPAGKSWEINCSQLCGLAHYRMRALYRVMPRAAFDAWLREEEQAQQAQAQSPQAPQLLQSLPAPQGLRAEATQAPQTPAPHTETERTLQARKESTP